MPKAKAKPKPKSLKRTQLVAGAAYFMAAKNGDLIVGCLEHLDATAWLSGCTLDEKGDKLELDYDGESQLYWDSQAPRLFKEQRQFITNNGVIVLEDDVRFILRDD